MKKYLALALMACSQLFAQGVMTPELLWKLGRVGNILPVGEDRVFFTVKYYNVKENSGTSDIYMIKGGKVTQVTDTPENESDLSYSKALKKVVFARGNKYYLAEPDFSSEKELLGVSKGTFSLRFSPDGSKAMFLYDMKVTQSTFQKYPHLPEANAKIIDDLMYRHWDHWEDESYTHLFISDFDGVRLFPAKELNYEEKYDVRSIEWSLDSKSIRYVSKKKFGKEDALSTNTDVYEHYIESAKTLNRTKGTLGYDTESKSHPTDGKVFARLSMKRDGYESDKNDIIITANGQEYNLTKDWNNTVSDFIWSNDGKKIFYLACVNATYQLFEIKVGSDYSKVGAASIRQITKGTHNFTSLAQQGKYLIAGRQDMNNATEVFRVGIKKGDMTQLSHVNDETYGLIKRGKVEERWINTTDGKKMLTWVIYPPDFDPAKKYPTLLYCQGGPQSTVSQFYSFRWNFQVMAAQGYIVVAPNRRGLPSFGVEWNEQISGDWGGQPMKDYFSAIDELSKESYVDENRLGAVGASYGGYSVYMLAGIHEKRFKTFISHCGLYNLESWYGVTEELFFANYDIGGAYWDEPKPMSYERFSPHKFAAKWDTPMMVIHGGKDFRVPENQGMEAFTLAQLKGIKSRFLYFPEEGHWILQPQNAILWHSEFFKWLKETL